MEKVRSLERLAIMLEVSILFVSVSWVKSFVTLTTLLILILSLPISSSFEFKTFKFKSGNLKNSIFVNDYSSLFIGLSILITIPVLISLAILRNKISRRINEKFTHLNH